MPMQRNIHFRCEYLVIDLCINGNISPSIFDCICLFIFLYKVYYFSLSKTPLKMPSQIYVFDSSIHYEWSLICELQISCCRSTHSIACSNLLSYWSFGRIYDLP